MWIALVVACVPSDPKGSRPTSGGDPSPSSPADDPTEPVVPMIGEALVGRCPNPGPGESLPQGDSLRVVTLAGPGRCNDGTPPKLYVRAATDPAHALDVVWFFDGGTKCLGNEDCAIRWCGEQWPFGQRHMSSDPLPYGIGGVGIASEVPENSFAGWNQVFAAYCSSDRWLGTHSDAVLEGEAPYRVHFEGAQVATDGIAAGVAGLVSDDGSMVLPSLADVQNLIVAGTSGGCQGAASQTRSFVVATPDAVVTTVLDSCWDPAAEVMDADLAAARDESELHLWEDGVARVHHGQPDPICTADHPDEPWRCTDIDVLARGYLDRVMTHHDQGDTVIYDDLGALGVSKAEYAQLAIDTYRLYEDVAPWISVHSNHCDIHTAIDGDGSFLHSTVVDAQHGGSPLSEHDVLVRALADEPTVAVDSNPPTTSVCE